MTSTLDQTDTNPVSSTVGTVTVRGKGELTGLLADLALSASTDPVMLMFTVIRLHTEGGRLHGWSTDRYRMGHAAVDAEGDLPDVVCICVADVKRIVSTFRLSLSLTMRVDVNAGRVDFDDGVNAASFTLPDLDGQRMDFYAQIGKDELPVGTTPLSYSGKYLEDLGKIGKRRATTVTMVGADGNKPSHIKIGADYRAWLMPMRDRDADGAWLPSVF